MKNINGYDLLAMHYDAWQTDLDEKRRSSYICRLLKKHGGNRFRKENFPEKYLCDLGCGTGKTIVSFAKLGFTSIGIDLSEVMLNLAGEHAREEGVSVALSQQDLRSFRLPEKMDVMLCLTDTINHLTGDKDIPRFFKKVYQNLQSGGFFIFDFIAPNYFETILEEKFYYFIDEKRTLFWENHYSAEKRLNRSDITMFTKSAGDLYRRDELEIVERSYLLSEMVDLLTASNLEFCAAYRDMTLISPSEQDHRVFVVSRKLRVVK